MLRKIGVLALIASLFVVGTVVAVDRSGATTDEGDSSDGVDNYCLTDWVGWCNAPDDPDERNFRWNLGYWLYQFDAGNVSYAGVPQEFQSSLPQLSSPECEANYVGSDFYYLDGDSGRVSRFAVAVYEHADGSYYLTGDCEQPVYLAPRPAAPVP